MRVRPGPGPADPASRSSGCATWPPRPSGCSSCAAAAGVLAHAATRDPLTGLPNRSLLEESLERAFARRDRTGAEPGLLFVDLDGFKAINDTLGHATGDAALREVAAPAADLRARVATWSPGSAVTSSWSWSTTPR